MTDERLEKLNDLRDKIIRYRNALSFIEGSGYLNITRINSDPYSFVINKEDDEFIPIINALKSKLKRLEKEYEEG